jgi:hypothetical protein
MVIVALQAEATDGRALNRQLGHAPGRHVDLHDDPAGGVPGGSGTSTGSGGARSKAGAREVRVSFGHGRDRTRCGPCEGDYGSTRSTNDASIWMYPPPQVTARMNAVSAVMRHRPGGR